jgi:hypothetical protein
MTMKRMLGLVLTLAVMVGMSMPTFAQDKGKAAETKKAETKKAGKEGDAKKSEKGKKASKKGADKDAKKEATPAKK